MCDLGLTLISFHLFSYMEIEVSRQVQDEDKTKSEQTTAKGKMGTPGPMSNTEGKKSPGLGAKAEGEV